MEERKGFLTPEQEKLVDKLIELKGVYEAMDGTAIKLADNVMLEKLKAKIPPDVLPIVYQVVDEIILSLSTLAKA